MVGFALPVGGDLPQGDLAVFLADTALRGLARAKMIQGCRVKIPFDFRIHDPVAGRFADPSRQQLVRVDMDADVFGHTQKRLCPAPDQGASLSGAHGAGEVQPSLTVQHRLDAVECFYDGGNAGTGSPECLRRQGIGDVRLMGTEDAGDAGVAGVIHGTLLNALCGYSEIRFVP